MKLGDLGWGLALCLVGCGGGDSPRLTTSDSQSASDSLGTVTDSASASAGSGDASASATGSGTVSATSITATGTASATGTATGGSASGDGGSGTTGSTGAGDSGSGTTGPNVVPCDVSMATLDPVTPNVMFVLDKSVSMLTDWDQDGDMIPDGTRWSSLYAVVQQVVTTFDGSINFGATLFPSLSATNFPDQTACTVSSIPEVPVAPMNGLAILAGIPPAASTSLQGGTPATAGITTAVAHLQMQNPANPPAIVFITDGAANCIPGTMFPEIFNVFDTALETTVADALTVEGIPTYVVGIDILNMDSGSVVDGNPDNINPFVELNAVAVAGGRPAMAAADFYETQNQLQLEAALQQIIDDALSCVVPLSPAPAFPDLLELDIGGMTVPRVTDCTTEDGWVYTNPMGPFDEIELCGTWCDQLRMVGSATAQYFCVPA